MAVRRTRVVRVPEAVVHQRLRRLAAQWCAPAVDPATPENVEACKAVYAGRLAELMGRPLAEAEIRELRG